ncbi:MAG: type II toxin-antitoxin system MqsR family toxin [Acidobacteriaceae bacterium]|nr:type II toxin-antitoxin system MqsR family toxin [Acidobacteriaceae bacterium]
MEKKKAHYSLPAIKAIVARDGVFAFTATARHGFRDMGLSETEALEVVALLSNSMLFKSMTTHSCCQVWQDVYHAPCPNGKTAYIKVTMQDGAVVIQFKEL